MAIDFVTTEIIGSIGAILIFLAYIPQITHIHREHCSGGISKNSWLIWLVASAFLLTHAVAINDIIFIMLQVVNITSVIIILAMIQFYEARVCHSKEDQFKVRSKTKKKNNSTRFL